MIDVVLQMARSLGANFDSIHRRFDDAVDDILALTNYFMI
jgi:hypothetical protein